MDRLYEGKTPQMRMWKDKGGVDERTNDATGLVYDDELAFDVVEDDLDRFG